MRNETGIACENTVCLSPAYRWIPWYIASTVTVLLLATGVICATSPVKPTTIAAPADACHSGVPCLDVRVKAEAARELRAKASQAAAKAEGEAAEEEDGRHRSKFASWWNELEFFGGPSKRKRTQVAGDFDYLNETSEALSVTETEKNDETLAGLLRDGTIRLLNCRWLREQPDNPPFIIKRHQDLMRDHEREAFLDPSEAAELFLSNQRRVAALSYGWLTPRHPDPKGFTARAVLRFLRGTASESSSRSNHPRSPSESASRLNEFGPHFDGYPDFGARTPD